MIRFPGMDSLPAVLLAVRWSGVIGNAVCDSCSSDNSHSDASGMLMSFKDKLKARGQKVCLAHEKTLLECGKCVVRTEESSSRHPLVRCRRTQFAKFFQLSCHPRCRCLATAPYGCSSNACVQNHYRGCVSSQFTFCAPKQLANI